MQKLSHTIIQYLEWAPKSLVIRETCRIWAIESCLSRFTRPGMRILDVGCGDGRWWKILDPDRRFDVFGIDINPGEVEKARGSIQASVADVTQPDELQNFPADFEFAIGNCSLEHIPKIHEALKNIHGKLSSGAHLVIFVPTPDWALRGKSIEFLGSISPRLSMAFSGLLNGFFQHWHLYHYGIWNHLLQSSGFDPVEVQGLGSRRLEFLFRLHLPAAFISFLVKSLTGNYFNYYWSKVCPRSLLVRSASELEPLVKDCLTSKDDEDAFEYLIIARKR